MLDIGLLLSTIKLKDMVNSNIFGSSLSYIENFDGYFVIVAGQSNSTDRFTVLGNLPAALQGVQANSYTFYKPVNDFSDNGSWVQTNTGVNTQQGTAQTGMFGVNVVLASRLFNTYGKPAYVVPCGVAGTYIADSVVPSWNVNHIGEYYKKMVETVNQAYIKIRKKKKLKPVLVWIHGESDSEQLLYSQAYQTNVFNMLTQFRIDTGFLNIPYILTYLRPDYAGGTTPGIPDIELAQTTLPTLISNTTLINTNTAAYPLSTDTFHYTPITANYPGVQAAINLGNTVGDVVHNFVRPINQSQYWKQGTTTATSDTEANALLVAMGTDPGPINEPAIQSFFINYKAQAGITSLTQQFGFLAMLAAHDSHAALLWWNDPSKLMTLGGVSPGFVANRGFKNSGNGWIDTLFNISTGANYSQNNGAVFVYVRDNIAEDKTDLGIMNAIFATHIQARSTANKINSTLNQVSTLSINATDARGLWFIRRVNGNYMEVYKNGCFWGGAVKVSLTPLNGNLTVLAMNDLQTGNKVQFSTKQIAEAGACNNKVNPLIFYNNSQTYMTAVGANV